MSDSVYSVCAEEGEKQRRNASHLIVCFTLQKLPELTRVSPLNDGEIIHYMEKLQQPK